VVQVAVDVLFGVLDADLHGSKAILLHLLGREATGRQAKRRDGGVQWGQIHSGVDQRPQHHVAADPRGAVEIGNSHKCFSGREFGRSISPRPLSIDGVPPALRSAAIRG